MEDIMDVLGLIAGDSNVPYVIGVTDPKTNNDIYIHSGSPSARRGLATGLYEVIKNKLGLSDKGERDET